MINLIPPEAVKRAKIEYWLRVVSTFSFLVGAAAIVLIASQIPTYVLIDAQIKDFNEASVANQERDDAIRDAETVAEETHALIAQLKQLPDGILHSKLLADVRKANPGSISYKQFSINKKDDVITDVVVQGVSPTRSELAQYKVQLESNPLFESADVPISDLARDADLPFVITITLATDI